MAAGPSGGELQPQPTPSDRQTPPEAEKQKAGTRAAVTPLPMLPVGRPSQEPRCRQAQAVPVATEEGPLLPGQGVRAGCSSAPRPLPLPMPGPGLKSRCAVLRGGEKGASDLCARLRWAPARPPARCSRFAGRGQARGRARHQWASRSPQGAPAGHRAAGRRGRPLAVNRLLVVAVTEHIPVWLKTTQAQWLPVPGASVLKPVSGAKVGVL